MRQARMRDLFEQLQREVAESYGVEPEDVEAVLFPGTVALLRSPATRPDKNAPA